MDTCAANPENKEKTTIKIEVAAAILVGTLKIYIRRGTMKTPAADPQKACDKTDDNADGAAPDDFSRSTDGCHFGFHFSGKEHPK